MQYTWDAIGSLSCSLTCSDRLETCQKSKTNVFGIRKITFVVANHMPRGYGSCKSPSLLSVDHAKEGLWCENVRLPFQVLNFMLYEPFSFFDSQLLITLRMSTLSLYLALLFINYHFRKSANSLMNSRSCPFSSNKQCKKTFFSIACLSHCIPNSCTSLAITFDWISS